MVTAGSKFAARSTVTLPHVEAGQRIGLLGGSFNPAHEAHVLISQIALKRLGLDRVWWLVTPGNPFKTGPDVAALQARVAGAKRLVHTPDIVVADFEKHLTSRYTVDTIEFLTRVRPRVTFVWVMGADCLAEFHRWRSWRSIFRMVPVAVVDRPGFHLKALASPAARAFASHRLSETLAGRLTSRLRRRRLPRWVFLTGPLSTQSSTKIRRLRAK